MKENNFGSMIQTNKTIYHNLSKQQLTTHAVKNENDVRLSKAGAIVIDTFPITGRSAKNKYVVDDKATHDVIDWNTHNQPIDAETYQAIKQDTLAYLSDKELFIFDGYAGSDRNFRRSVRVYNECASQNLFIQNLLIQPELDEIVEINDASINIICAPHFYLTPEKYGLKDKTIVLLNLEQKEVIICGTKYSGEIKKSVFVMMNYLLPQEDVLPMHCSANIGMENDDVAVFFGLSGTGKTTLSTDPQRKMIGDDEHGWSDNGVFNIEGGIYAKCLDLSRDAEPEIYDAIRPGSVVENVTLLEDGTFDFADRRRTQNSRVGFPLSFIDNAAQPSIGGHPKNIIFLTADAFGVLPPVSKLTTKQAMYHFLSGYTSKVAGTEQGITEPTTTFSSCFGAPFLPYAPARYAELLGKKMQQHQANVYLVNTGWTGGAYGIGKRISLKDTRAIITAIIDGSLLESEYEQENIFDLNVPRTCPNVDANILNPRNTWESEEDYIAQAEKLAERFKENFTQHQATYDKMLKEF